MDFFQHQTQQTSSSSSSSLFQGTWKKASFNIPEDMGRTYHASVMIDQYLVIIGGVKTKESREIANLVVFDLQKETFTEVEISGRKPTCLIHPSACYWKDNQIIVYGGEDASKDRTLFEVGIITLSFTEPMKAEWKAIKTDPKLRRQQHTAHICNNNEMIAFGGVGKSYSLDHSVNSLNLDDGKWRYFKMAERPHKGGLSFHTSVLHGNEIYVFGRNAEEECGFSLMTPSGEYPWKSLPLAPGESHKSFTVMQEHKGKIYLLSDAESQPRMTLKSYDISEGKWSSDMNLKDESLLIRADFSLNVYDNQLVLYGGTSSLKENSSTNELWFFRLGDSEKHRIKRNQHLKDFLTEAPYSDVTFEVESEQIRAHKWWLSNKSKYFANMFSSGMMEAQSSKIVVSDMSAITFKAFLEYLYSEDIELDFTLAKELLTQADKYSVPELKGLCEQFLIGNIAPDNFVSLANLSELLEANKLRDAVRDYIAKNIKSLKPRKDFEEISLDMLRDVVVKVTVK